MGHKIGYTFTQNEKQKIRGFVLKYIKQTKNKNLTEKKEKHRFERERAMRGGELCGGGRVDLTK